MTNYVHIVKKCTKTQPAIKELVLVNHEGTAMQKHSIGIYPKLRDAHEPTFCSLSILNKF